MKAARAHGGPDASGVPVWDFSSNSNACGPCPTALECVQRADASRYPDPSYRVLRERIAALHDVPPARIVPAASASEFIFRVTALAARMGLRQVRLPRHGYGDYRHAASAWGLELTTSAKHCGDSQPVLAWACEPSSPEGGQDTALGRGCHAPPGSLRVLDRAYEPLRLDGAPSLGAAELDGVWQLFSPNKALGLTGVRAGYAIAPQGGDDQVQALERLACSWPLGAHGVALLQAWCEPRAQRWLQESRLVLREWKAAQLRLLETMGWTVLPGLASFMLCRPPGPLPPLLAGLRQRGIKLRDCASFGLPACARLSVQPPPAQAALRDAWGQLA